jgi:acetyltransferase-like isoleucine patch superfamily enzyme
MADIVFFGTGQSAQLAKVYIEAHSAHRIVGFTVDPQYVTLNRFEDLPVVAWERLEQSFPPDQVELLGPISYARMNEFRRDRYLEGKARNYRFASFIHPDCHIYTQEIGEHCFILETNIIEPFTKIGDNVVIWGRSHIGHHVTIGDHCFISADCVIGARTRIDQRSFLGIRVTTLPDIMIGEACMIGVGVVLRKDVAPESVVVSWSENRVAPFPSSRARRLL